MLIELYPYQCVSAARRAPFERLLEMFTEFYVAANPTCGMSRDDVLVLAFAIIQLQTDLCVMGHGFDVHKEANAVI